MFLPNCVWMIRNIVQNLKKAVLILNELTILIFAFDKTCCSADRAAAGPAGNEEGPLRHTLHYYYYDHHPTTALFRFFFPLFVWYHMTSYVLWLWLLCAGISVGKEKLKFKSDLTSLDDKLRIANKVNNKYLELGWTDVKDYEGWL